MAKNAVLPRFESYAVSISTLNNPKLVADYPLALSGLVDIVATFPELLDEANLLLTRNLM
jgi:hypothetical protein